MNSCPAPADRNRTRPFASATTVALCSGLSVVCSDEPFSLKGAPATRSRKAWAIQGRRASRSTTSSLRKGFEERGRVKVRPTIEQDPVVREAVKEPAGIERSLDLVVVARVQIFSVLRGGASARSRR